jgi:cell wall-associated NlpC family hydrolase
MRAEPSDSAEMVSQVLFGEFVSIAKISGNWIQVRTLYDDYTGWVDGKQVLKTTKAFMDGAADNSSVSIELAQSAASPSQHIPLLLGSSLPYFDGMNFRINKEKFVFNGQAVMPGQNGKTIVLEKVVNKLLNAPYLWGGRSPFGMDCSGFTQVVFKTLGIQLPRDSIQQAECGQTISFISAAQTGDLAFFENKQGKIAHVGIITREGKIAHAYGQVRIDSIDHQGIFNNESKSYTHKLRLIKRLF